ncbi:MAG: hypothetical protein Q8N56_02980 [bacterium]|nr:hypothetical protein [bacterium]
MKAKEVIALLKDSQAYKEYSELCNVFRSKSGILTQEERGTIFDAVEKMDKEFIKITNRTVCNILSCCRNHGYKDRIEKFKLAILIRCTEEMPDYYQYLEEKLSKIWNLKKKKTR